MESNPCYFLENLNCRLIEELENILLQEELFWKQRSRDHWIALGDRNTSYFHSLASINKGKNKILTLKDSDNKLVTDQDSLKLMARDFFLHLYSNDSDDINLVTTQGFCVLT